MQDVVLEKLSQLCGKFSLNNITVQRYTILYLSSKALSLDEMAERLKASEGSVSINIRALERYGAVRRFGLRVREKTSMKLKLI